LTKIGGSGSVSQRYGSADPDPYQNVTDPEHSFEKIGVVDPDAYFLILLDPGPPLFVRILPSTSKKSKKNFDLYYVVTSF
jgi:hypothetical protein